MKRRNLWILLAVLVGLAVILLIAIPRNSGEEKEQGGAEQTQQEAAPTPEPTPVDAELPMDQTPLVPAAPSEGTEASDSAPDEQKQEGDQPDDSGEEPEEDELPVVP